MILAINLIFFIIIIDIIRNWDVVNNAYPIIKKTSCWNNWPKID